MGKSEVKPGLPDLGFEEPHTPPQQEAKPSNLRSADEGKKGHSRPSRLSSRQRALYQMVTSQYSAENQLGEDDAVQKQGPQEELAPGWSQENFEPAPKKLSFREAARVIGDFEAGKPAVVSPESAGNALVGQEVDGDSFRVGETERASLLVRDCRSKVEVPRGDLGQKNRSEALFDIDLKKSIPPAEGSLSLLKMETERRNSEADDRPYNLPNLDLFDIPHTGKNLLKPRVTSGPPGHSGSESDDDLTNQYRGNQKRPVGTGSFYERLRAYEALNWESPEELGKKKPPRDSDERTVSAEGRLTGGPYGGPSGTDRRAKFATVGARAAAAYDIRGSPVSDTRASLVDSGDGFVGDKRVSPRDVMLREAESPGVRSARALRSIYSGFSRDQKAERFEERTENSEADVLLNEPLPKNSAAATDLSFEQWRPESEVRVIGKTTPDTEPGSDPEAKKPDHGTDSSPGKERRVANRVSFAATGSARARKPRAEVRWAAIQKSLKRVQNTNSSSERQAGKGEQGLEVGSASGKATGGSESKDETTFGQERENKAKDRSLNTAFGSLFYPSQSAGSNPYDNKANLPRDVSARKTSTGNLLPRKTTDWASENGQPVRTSSFYSRKGLELDDRGLPVGVGERYRTDAAAERGHDGGSRLARGRETDLAWSMAELAGNREWRSHENYLTPEAEIRGAQKSAKGLGDERDPSQALAVRVGREKSVWVATTQGSKRSVIRTWAGLKRGVKRAVVWMGLAKKGKDKKMAINLERRPTFHRRAASTSASLDADSDPEHQPPAALARRTRGGRSVTAIKRLWRRIMLKLTELSARASRAEEASARDASSGSSSDGWATRVARQAAARARSGRARRMRTAERIEGRESSAELAPSGAKTSSSTVRQRSAQSKKRVDHGGQERLKAPRALQTNKDKEGEGL